MTAQTQQERPIARPIPVASVSMKLLVSLTGLFLIVFLVVHLSVNLTMLAGRDTYNAAADWMGTNPGILVMQPVLALGVLAHFVVSGYLWLTDLRTRPLRYSVVDRAGGSTWASRNMLILGAVILLFLILHLSSYWIPLTYGTPPMTELAGEPVEDVYALVTGTFGVWWYAALYVVAFVCLGLHLSHGFQSAIQTLGLSDARWRTRWTVLGNLYAVIVAVGFITLPVFFFVQAQLSSAP